MRATVILNLLNPVTRISREPNVDLKRRDQTSAVRLTQNHAFPERAPDMLLRELEVHPIGTRHESHHVPVSQGGRVVSTNSAQLQ